MVLARWIRAALLAGAFAGASLVAGAPAGCAADEGTTGKRVALELRVTGSAGARAPFTNATGWTVTLDRALLATGPMTFFDGATIFSRAPARGLSFGGRAAFAHPGHYVPGEARGEVGVASSVDLRGDTVVGAGAGVSGVVRSATFRFGAPPSGPFAGELAGNVVVLEGTAVRGPETRRFRAEVSASEVLDTAGAPAVEGCPFAETDVEGDGIVTLTVKVEVWFDQVDFADVAPGAAGAPAVLAPGSFARNALTRGMKAGTPYAFAFRAR